MVKIGKWIYSQKKNCSIITVALLIILSIHRNAIKEINSINKTTERKKSVFVRI